MTCTKVGAATVAVTLMLTFPGRAAAGSIAGSVAFTGGPPRLEKQVRKSDAFCAKSESVDPSVVLSKDGKALANVVVRLKNPPPSASATTAGAASAPVVIDQQQCLYVPHVAAAMEGQKLVIRSSDPTLHNVHAYAGSRTAFNQAQPPKAREISKDLKGVEVLSLKCDVHPWMSAHVVVHKHPFFAVSAADGTFELKDVPPGKYTVEAWHERFGTRTVEVEVKDGAVDPKLSFDDKKS